MSRAYDQLQALIPRLDTFLSRLTQRGEEVCNEAAQAIVSLRSTGTPEAKARADQLQGAAELGLREIVDKGHAAFRTHFGPFEQIDDEAVEDLYERLEEHMEGWERSIFQIGKNVFRGHEDINVREMWEKAVADWQNAAQTLTCPQCAAPIPIPELYTEAVYLPCSGCGTRTTFNPSGNMRMAKVAALELAKIESRPALDAFKAAWADENIAPGLAYSHYANYIVTRQRKLAELLPSAAREERPDLAEEFAQWVSAQDLELEPQGYWQTDLTYVNMLSGLTELIDESRRVNADEDAAIAIEMAEAVARPGCPIVQAIMTGTIHRDLLAKHAQMAMSRPPLPAGRERELR
ncbi:MAG: hypothetical protein Q4C87_10625 [Actinomycetaceae bacterium]|nr:hypothetical protein [Actinomycetaceae bacterium]